MPILDTNFEWPLSAGGYQLEEREDLDPKRKGSVELWIAPRGKRVVTHKPLEFHPTLFVDFARLDGKAEGCIEFASRFGFLGEYHHYGTAWKRYSEGMGEELTFWRQAIKDMRAAVELWEKDPKALCLDESWGTKRAMQDFRQLEIVLVPDAPEARPSLRI